MKSLFLIGLILLLNLFTFIEPSLGDGPGEGGGSGKGILCDNDTSLQLLDLYEAKERGWKLPIIDKNIKNVAYATLLDTVAYLNDPGATSSEKYQKEFSINFDKFWNSLVEEKNTEYLTWSDDDLPFLQDASLPKISSKCRFVQIAIHKHSFDPQLNRKIAKITLNRKLVRMLFNDPIQLIGLFTHEIIYSMITDITTPQNVQIKVNSDEAREITGALVTGQPLPNRLGIGYDSTKRTLCHFGGGTTLSPNDPNEEIFEVYVRDIKIKGKQGSLFYFNIFKGLETLSLTSGFFPGFNSKMLTDMNFKPKKSLIQDLFFPHVQVIDPIFSNFFPERSYFTVRSGLNSKTVWTIELGRTKIKEGFGNVLYMRAYEYGTPDFKKPAFSLGSCTTEYVPTEAY